MRAIISALICAFAVGVVAQSTGAQTKATLKNAEGQTVGDAVLTDTPHGVLIHVSLTKVSPGVHAVHIHESGTCQPPFTSAGAHFNPTKKQHGLQNMMGMHAGDLPNVQVPADGALTFDVVAPDVTLAAGANSLLDADGSAILIHDKTDDYKSDPAGNAGDRIICGVIAR
jgi:Cu-Zn family superoxide dismutase